MTRVGLAVSAPMGHWWKSRVCTSGLSANATHSGRLKSETGLPAGSGFSMNPGMRRLQAIVAVYGFEGEVSAEPDLLELLVGELLAREAVQMLWGAQWPGARRSGPRARPGLARCADEHGRILALSEVFVDGGPEVVAGEIMQSSALPWEICIDDVQI